jgi:nitrate/TMAO reductase-like tetraheme cytochrome c subunit
MRGPDFKDSMVSRSGIPLLCGQCHKKEKEEYLTGIHGIKWANGDTLVAVCVDCHSVHGIFEIKDPRSTVYATKSAKTCARCHGDSEIMPKYSHQVETFAESFHGIAQEFGVKRAANCVSCHEYHIMLPQDNPKSSINPANLPKTCGKCHPNAGKTVAMGKIHVDARDPSSGIVYWVSMIFKYLTITIIVGLVLHIILDLSRKFRETLKSKGGNE